jgi:HAD superfamily hydrolase (TIGR01509 family)
VRAQAPILLFDVMDTLVHDPFYAEVLEFFGLDLEALFEAKSKECWKAFELGRLGRSDMREAYFNGERLLDLEGLERCMSNAYRFLDGIEAILVELRASGVPMYALSNYPSWYTLIEEKLRLSRYLRWDFVSCRTGVRKPAPEAYRGPARVLGIEPSSCVFVDDRAKNCVGAEAVGMDAIVFEDAPALRAALRKRGLL